MKKLILCLSFVCLCLFGIAQGRGSYAVFTNCKDYKTWKDALEKEGVKCVNLSCREKKSSESILKAIKTLDAGKAGVVAVSKPSEAALDLALTGNVDWAVLSVDELGGKKAGSQTCPMCLMEGKASNQLYRELRRRHVPAELHICPYERNAVYARKMGMGFLYQMGFIGPLGPVEDIDVRYATEENRAKYWKEDVWPEGKMPDAQAHQQLPYMEWHIPANLKTTAIQIMYSGGGYEGNSPEWFEVAPIRRYLNEQGMTVVTLSYRYPRPKGLPKYLTAWQDLQRTIRIVRSKAAGLGLDPDRIGVYGCSAGGHLTMLGAVSSSHNTYEAVDDLDNLPCNVQWGIAIYPAYLLTDGIETVNTAGGNEDDSVLAPELLFDSATAPVLFLHGDADAWAAMNSVKSCEKLQQMGVDCEVHTYATRDHHLHRYTLPGTGSYYALQRISDFLTWQKVLGE